MKVKFAPINPSDLYFYKGVYGIKPELPAIVGFECVGEVIHVYNKLGCGIGCINQYW